MNDYYDDDYENEMVDGFEEAFTFQGHRLNIRGFNTVSTGDSDDSMFTTDESKASGDIHRKRHAKEQYISWDTKQLILWERKAREKNPIILHTVKFAQANFICSVVSISKPKIKMQVLLAAALDMSFKIYDRHLNLVESIKHEERAILQLICDEKKDIILSSGAAGIAVWRFYKNSIIDTCHIMEKLFVLDGCNHWVSKMIYEPAFDRVYVMNDRSVKVFNLTRHIMQAELVNAHQAPVTAACWYARNQFYLTGCRF